MFILVRLCWYAVSIFVMHRVLRVVFAENVFLTAPDLFQNVTSQGISGTGSLRIGANFFVSDLAVSCVYTSQI